MSLISPILGSAFFLAASLTARAALTVIPIADNYTFKAEPDNNQNAAAATLSVKVANAAQGNARTAFFKFDTSSASVVVDGPSAVFRVTNTLAATTLFRLRVYALNSGDAGYNWKAADSSVGAGDGITWTNSPAFSSSAINYLDTGRITEVGTFDIADNTAIGGQFSVTLNNWTNFVQTDGSLTLIAVVYGQTAGGSTMSLGSSENGTAAYRPTLTFVPEPSTLALAALGSISLFRRKR